MIRTLAALALLGLAALVSGALSVVSVLRRRESCEPERTRLRGAEWEVR